MRLGRTSERLHPLLRCGSLDTRPFIGRGPADSLLDSTYGAHSSWSLCGTTDGNFQHWRFGGTTNGFSCVKWTNRGIMLCFPVSIFCWPRCRGFIIKGEPIEIKRDRYIICCWPGLLIGGVCKGGSIERGLQQRLGYIQWNWWVRWIHLTRTCLQERMVTYNRVTNLLQR